MAILNYTTSIEAGKTVGEIQQLLAKKGAKKVVVDFNDNGDPIGITFGALVSEGNMIYFSLPSNHLGVFKALKSHKIASKYQTEEQALKVSWRIIKDWVSAQMAIIEAQVAELPQVFLPYAINNDGQTLYQVMKNNPTKLLNS